MQESLSRFLEIYIEQHGITAASLFDKAGLSHSIYTHMKQGAIPKPDTLRKLAVVMLVPNSVLFLKAGYLQKDDLEMNPIYDFPDDELSFVLGYRKLPELGKCMIRGMLGFYNQETNIPE